MPANGRWDLIRRLKVKMVTTNKCFVPAFFLGGGRRIKLSAAPVPHISLKFNLRLQGTKTVHGTKQNKTHKPHST